MAVVGLVKPVNLKRTKSLAAMVLPVALVHSTSVVPLVAQEYEFVNAPPLTVCTEIPVPRTNVPPIAVQDVLYSGLLLQNWKRIPLKPLEDKALAAVYRTSYDTLDAFDAESLRVALRAVAWPAFTLPGSSTVTTSDTIPTQVASLPNNLW